MLVNSRKMQPVICIMHILSALLENSNCNLKKYEASLVKLDKSEVLFYKNLTYLLLSIIITIYISVFHEMKSCLFNYTWFSVLLILLNISCPLLLKIFHSFYSLHDFVYLSDTKFTKEQCKAIIKVQFQIKIFGFIFE